MTIQVQIGNTGKVVEFPDGTPTAEMEAALQKYRVKTPQQAPANDQPQQNNQGPDYVAALAKGQSPGMGSFSYGAVSPPDAETAKKQLKTAITAGEIAAPFVLGPIAGKIVPPLAEALGVAGPVSAVADTIGASAFLTPGVMAAGEGTKSLLSGEDTKTAGKKALIGAGIDAGISAATFGLIGGIKALGKGESISKSILRSSAEDIRPEIMDEAFQKPTLLNSPSITMDKAGEIATNAIEKKQRQLGQLIGEAKARLKGKEIPLDISAINQGISDIKEAAGITGKPGDLLLKEGRIGRSAFKKIDEYVNVLEDASMHYGADGITSTPEALYKNTIDNAQRALENIDNSTPFQLIYKKLNEGAGLSKSESSALKARDVLRDEIVNTAGKTLDEAGLGSAKRVYSEFMQIITNPLIRRASRGADKATGIIKNSFSVGKNETYNLLRSLDNLLPAGQKFMDEATRNAIDNRISTYGIKNLASINSAISSAASSMARQNIKSGEVVSSGLLAGIHSGATMGATEIANYNDPYSSGYESDQQQPLQSPPDQSSQKSVTPTKQDMQSSEFKKKLLIAGASGIISPQSFISMGGKEALIELFSNLKGTAGQIETKAANVAKSAPLLIRRKIVNAVGNKNEEGNY